MNRKNRPDPAASSAAALAFLSVAFSSVASTAALAADGTGQCAEGPRGRVCARRLPTGYRATDVDTSGTTHTGDFDLVPDHGDPVEDPGAFTAGVRNTSPHTNDFATGILGCARAVGFDRGDHPLPPLPSPEVCPAQDAESYPYAHSAPDKPDRWGFYTRECTSFVAWRLNQAGIALRDHDYPAPGIHWGDAAHWADAARQAGIPVDRTPVPGAVAQFPPGVDGASSHGHVAWVLQVNADGTVTVEDYNWHGHTYLQHSIDPSGVNFIHFTR